MRRAQGLPVNMIVLVALALLVMVVVGAFFISGFGQAAGSIQGVNATEAQCHSMCQSLVTAAFNYQRCEDLETNPQYHDDKGTDDVTDDTGYGVQCAFEYGACTVTIRGGGRCRCDDTGCQSI
jgi:hypothetical protein